MNTQIIEGNWNLMKGRVKELWGRLTDDDVLKIDGKSERLIGMLEQRYGYSREQAERESERLGEPGSRPTGDGSGAATEGSGGTIHLPRLPYAENALEPHISAETLRVHHGAHHAGYVKKANRLLAGSRWERAALEQIVRESDGALLQNAAQAWNHGFYWESLAPAGGHGPDAGLRSALERDFGSVEAFRKAFSELATSHFGSGWAWLVREPSGRLAVRCTHDAGCPLRDGLVPLLVCDVWEHAYYLDRRNDRAAYVEHFWPVVDWRRVQSRLERAQATQGDGSGPRAQAAPPKVGAGG